ncbi:MAG TPA: bifunctional salicylyl-CoA 5-hydroxylase/oxidoreductase [Hydrogenophaga sp.]|uniref:bifunctional salicylyl-CoA 5-hydroxylase/oxidoreductase n=1 Tax=Hydrogenophaga sp. TaxID=1904254 RepID=UPI0008C18C55|nr:bifunctional salicylyl-CoA 5-hydroxylase/oxidoreductase [Hydrogenophaga sp.]OGA75344.1 MAG: salicylyl-CoA 5-hydroxylase [Burkholderiales bacterium GWE1_65_30]OGA93476.1 MAG: salicylyl-CoA 5-hydroxylase [Burkholderiales bacterium GWF1_66_17]HAX19460.1 bifunctional salicylyl-CoA 5-hydroxylase/oxidoreductase [Hydrogenophaga sp.]HBU17777.1 bifunctional salicylyl-CoA 5-hydroxylase/oxidoreductase [Hydrogenophaga sp.]
MNTPLPALRRILCIGGGPAGLYFGLLMKRRYPDLQVTVVERNRPFDTFGWGVVFSDQTLQNLKRADPESAQQMADAFNHWDDIEVFYKDRSVRSTGHGFIGIGRKRLLNILQERCLALGVDLVFETDVTDDQALAQQYNADLVIASDGLNSRIRTRYETTYQPDIDTRKCRFVWLGTQKTFDAFTFAFEQTEHGWFQAHAYKFDDQTSTFIVETPEDVWQAHGLEHMSQEEGVAFCEKLFAKYLDGNALISNAKHLRGSANWIRFPRVICQTWVHWQDVAGKQTPIVLMGDAAHTAHFSIGSGTKLALEDAIDLAYEFRDAAGRSESMEEVLKGYEARRSVEVLKIQNAARNSTEWFENVDRYTGMDIQQFAYSLLTRSQRISHENLRLRDPQWLEGYEAWLEHQARPGATVGRHPTPPMLLPLTVRGLTLKNRIVVSPMAQYSATDGVAGDYHLVHLGARAMGGAALVMVEMTSPTPEGRITPGCPGLWNDEQQAAFARIADFVHTRSSAKIGLQLGHSGAKGSTQLGWEQIDEPLPSGNWPLLSASAVPYGPQNQVPSAMTRADMDAVTAAFVESTRRAAAAGFDWLELHCAHGYLLSAFICPLTNERTDDYGGSLENRCRYPLEVFAAMRAVWPADKPMSVRISAHDWAPGGNTPDDAVAMARLFKAAGCDVIDVSSGQTTRQAKPVYGRMYQTPFADRVRNEAGILTMAVGAITEADHANSIIGAGRADLCAVARAHLADPAWTLHEAAKLQTRAIEWPRPYESGRDQLYREVARQQALQGSVATTDPAEAP